MAEIQYRKIKFDSAVEYIAMSKIYLGKTCRLLTQFEKKIHNIKNAPLNSTDLLERDINAIETSTNDFMIEMREKQAEIETLLNKHDMETEYYSTVLEPVTNWGEEVILNETEETLALSLIPLEDLDVLINEQQSLVDKNKEAVEEIEAQIKALSREINDLNVLSELRYENVDSIAEKQAKLQQLRAELVSITEAYNTSTKTLTILQEMRYQAQLQAIQNDEAYQEFIGTGLTKEELEVRHTTCVAEINAILSNSQFVNGVTISGTSTISGINPDIYHIFSSTGDLLHETSYTTEQLRAFQDSGRLHVTSALQGDCIILPEGVTPEAFEKLIYDTTVYQMALNDTTKTGKKKYFADDIARGENSYAYLTISSSGWDCFQPYIDIALLDETELNLDHHSQEEIDMILFMLINRSEESNKEAKKYIKSILEADNQLDGFANAEPIISSWETMTDAELLVEATNSGFNEGIKNFLVGLAEIVAADGVISADQYEQMAKIQYLQSRGVVIAGSYELFLTIGNMVPAIVVSAAITIASQGAAAPKAAKIVASTLMGMSAAGHAQEEALQMGADRSAALLYGALIGGSEAVLGYFLGKIPGMSETSGLTLGNLLQEGSEEFIQEWIGAGLSCHLLGEEFDLTETTEASAKAFLMGVLCAGVMNAGSGVAAFVYRGVTITLNGDRIISLVNQGSTAIEIMNILADEANTETNQQTMIEEETNTVPPEEILTSDDTTTGVEPVASPENDIDTNQQTIIEEETNTVPPEEILTSDDTTTGVEPVASPENGIDTNQQTIMEEETDTISPEEILTETTDDTVVGVQPVDSSENVTETNQQTIMEEENNSTTSEEILTETADDTVVGVQPVTSPENVTDTNQQTIMEEETNTISPEEILTETTDDTVVGVEPVDNLKKFTAEIQKLPKEFDCSDPGHLAQARSIIKTFNNLTVPDIQSMDFSVRDQFLSTMISVIDVNNQYSAAIELADQRDSAQYFRTYCTHTHEHVKLVYTTSLLVSQTVLNNKTSGITNSDILFAALAHDLGMSGGLQIDSKTISDGGKKAIEVLTGTTKTISLQELYQVFNAATPNKQIEALLAMGYEKTEIDKYNLSHGLNELFAMGILNKVTSIDPYTEANTGEHAGISNTIRKMHSYNSPLIILSNFDYLTSIFGQKTVLLGMLTTFAHSKSNSGVKSLDVVEGYQMAFAKLKKGVAEHNKNNSNNRITILDDINGLHEFMAKAGVQFEELVDAATILRIADANAEKMNPNQIFLRNQANNIILSNALSNELILDLLEAKSPGELVEYLIMLKEDLTKKAKLTGLTGNEETVLKAIDTALYGKLKQDKITGEYVHSYEDSLYALNLEGKEFVLEDPTTFLRMESVVSAMDAIETSTSTMLEVKNQKIKEIIANIEELYLRPNLTKDDVNATAKDKDWSVGQKRLDIIVAALTGENKSRMSITNALIEAFEGEKNVVLVTANKGFVDGEANVHFSYEIGPDGKAIEKCVFDSCSTNIYNSWMRGVMERAGEIDSVTGKEGAKTKGKIVIELSKNMSPKVKAAHIAMLMQCKLQFPLIEFITEPNLLEK